MENMVNNSFWGKKRVFITGHTGFKGAWLTLWLKRLGGEVTGYALDPPSKPSLYELTHIADTIHDIRADVRDYDRLEHGVNNYGK